MATKLIHVCDFCGENATTTKTVDVCTTHARRPTAVRVASKRRGKAGGRTTWHSKMFECPECGRHVKGPGMATHRFSAHGVKGKGTMKAAKEVVRDDTNTTTLSA